MNEKLKKLLEGRDRGYVISDAQDACGELMDALADVVNILEDTKEITMVNKAMGMVESVSKVLDQL